MFIFNKFNFNNIINYEQVGGFAYLLDPAQVKQLVLTVKHVAHLYSH